MSASLKHVRITGVVAAANDARKVLAHGLEPAKRAAYIERVRGFVKQVEAICDQNGVRPSQLPAPSYRAYLLLAGIKPESIPAREPRRESAPPAGAIGLRNLGRLCAAIQDELWRGARPSAEALTKIQRAADSIDAVLQRHMAGPTALSAQSRRAYAWLRYLSHPDAFELHVTTLARLRALIDRPGVTVHLGNCEQIYRARVERGPGGAAHIAASEGLAGAPDAVLQALLDTAFHPRSTARAKVTAYANSTEYLEITNAIGAVLEPRADELKGRVFDLGEVFERVNRDHYAGAIARPRLRWSATLTRRTMGYYAFQNDVLMISASLDAPGVPAFVIDFVMFHELLHKQLGVRVAAGRTYAHTPEFRAAERRHPRYQEAMDFLKRLR